MNVRRAKEEYEEKLTSNENLRSFYGKIRSNNKATDKVGPLMDDVVVLHAENGSMAALLNGHFVNRVLSLNEASLELKSLKSDRIILRLGKYTKRYERRSRVLFFLAQMVSLSLFFKGWECLSLNH